MRERTGMPGPQNYIPESEFAANVDMVEAKLKPHGYNMICVDGWGDTSKVSANGYRLSHSRNWQHDFAWWSAHLRSRGMKLGMYANPLWLHADTVSPDAKIVGTDIDVLSLYDPADPWWVQIDRPGAEAYVKGYIKHFADMGIDYLRVDFLSWYETGSDRNFGNFNDPVPGTRPGGNGTERYATALRWMREAADEHGVFLSLVMPHLFNGAANEQLYGHMIRVNEDKFAGGWARWSDDSRGIKRVGWSVYANAMDGLTYWSYIAGRGKLILDSDFIRLNTFINDEERKTVISLCLLAGSPVTAADTYSTLGRHLWLYTNPEMLALNRDGFVGKPMTNDPTLPDSQIWTGQMSNGDWIVGLFNREEEPVTRSLDFRLLGFTEARVRDLWQHADLGTMSGVSFQIPPRGCRVFRVVPGAAALPGPEALRLASLQTGTAAAPSGGLRGRATWTVTDRGGMPVSGVLLTAQFGGSFAEQVSGYTDQSGRVVLTTTATVTERPVVQVEALDASKSGYAYAADLNAPDTTVSGPRMFAGGTFTEWRLQDFPMRWRQGAWRADRVAFGTHLFGPAGDNYEIKLADELYFLGQDWGSATGTTGTAQASTFNRGSNIAFSLGTNGLYNISFNPVTLAYSITPEWFSTDVGAVAAPGSVDSPHESSFVLRGSGDDIESTADGFHFLWQEHSGDLDLQVKVTGLTPTDPWAKAGLMIRSTTNAGSRHASILATPDNGVIFQRRGATGGGTSTVLATAPRLPVWLRLKKTGTSFQAFYSTEDTGWTQLAATNVGDIGASFIAGLASCSHANGTLTEARFEEFHLRTSTNSFFWSPANPVRGENAVLTYYANERPLAGSSEIYARILSNGDNEEVSPVPKMTRVSRDVWRLAINVPSSATNLAVSFFNETGAGDAGTNTATATGAATPHAAPTMPPGTPTGPGPYPFVTTKSVGFSWSPAADVDGLAPFYRVTVDKNGIISTRFTGSPEISVAGEVGDIISIAVQSVHPLDYSQSSPSTASGARTTILDPRGDLDFDGFNNGAEELAGTDPSDERSALRGRVAGVHPEVTIAWPSIPGKFYRVQWSDDLALASPGFAGQSEIIPAASGSTTIWIDPNPSREQRFYRILVEP